jgi:5-methylcytosine-specific restriction endonuclease McrA
MNRRYHIQPGEKFWRLTCIRLNNVGKHSRSYFLFKCDCGKEKVLLGSGVKSGNTKSCGCLSTESKKSKRLPDNKGIIYQIVLGYKRHSLNREHEWNLSLNDVRMLISMPCHYCGIVNSNKKTTKNFKEGFLYNGIDRVDNKKGYNISNCVPCCKQCNRAKGTLSKSEFITWIKAMALQWG